MESIEKICELFVTSFSSLLTRKLGVSIIKACKENLAIGGYSMNKDEVLKMSREENEGRHDEREIIAFGALLKLPLLLRLPWCL